MKILKTDCLSDGFRMPGEFEKQDGCLMIYPWRPGSWNYNAKYARDVFVEIAHILAAYEDVYMIVRPEDMKEASTRLAHPHIHIIEASSDDAWARDTGPTFVINDKGERRGINWEFNAWGGSYDGLYPHWENDQVIPSLICESLGDDLYEARPFVLEGGSIHVDGEGTLITTEECLLSTGRNPTMTRDEIEDKLKQYLNVE